MSKKIIALLLTLVTAMIPMSLCFTVSAAEPDYYIYTPHDLANANLSKNDFDMSVEEDDGTYLHLVAKAGVYNNNGVLLDFIDSELKLFDYPYIRIDYRTDSTVEKLDTTLHHSGGESWPASHPAMSGDGKWHTSVINAETISLPATVTVDKSEKGIAVRYKPFGSGNKALEKEGYFDIKFIGVFKTEAQATAYKFEEAFNEEAKDKYYGDTGFIKANGEEKLAEINAEIDAHIEKIKNTPTNVTVTGTKYYVAADGDDDNDGKTPETAWKTIKKVDEYVFKEGDGVFFKRGDSFRADGITLTLQNGVTYSAYGDGDKPVFVGSIDAANSLKWQETDTPNVYCYSDSVNDAGCIVFDGGRAWGIRMSPNGENSVDSGVVSNGIDEPFQSGGTPWDGYKTLKNNLEFCNSGGYVYLYSGDGNPGDVFENVEILWAYHGVNGTDIENVTFDNIKLFGYGCHGVSVHNVKNLYVQNCVFGWIGGSSHRLGNAVQNWENCDNFVIDMCYAYQIYDCAYTTQINDANGKEVYIKDFKIINTVTEYANTGLEVWNGNQTGNGDGNIHYINCELSGNYVRRNGYGWSHQRPNKDGNFYYGAFFGNTPTWENYQVFNNKFAVAYKYGLLSRHIAPINTNFHDNTYIMQRGKIFARTLSNYMEDKGPVTDFTYNDYTLEKMTADGIEAGGEFYYLDADYVPEPFDYENAKDIYPSETFSDISRHWAEDYIGYAVERGLYKGVSKTEFAPELNMTRAMFMTVLARFDGARLTDGEKWYDGAASWAVENALVDVSDIRPDENITRAEMAVMIKKYIEAKCIKYDGAQLNFADAGELTGELGEAVSVCVSAGIISGYDDNTFKPKNLSTRAQVAAVFTRLENYLRTAMPDINALVESGNAYVYNADALYNSMIVSTTNASKEVINDDGVSCLRFTPTVNKGTVQISLPQTKLDEGLDFYDYGVIRIKYKVQNGESKLDIGLRFPQEQWLDANGPYRPTNHNGVWTDAIICYEYFTGSSLVNLPFAPYENHIYTFKPWGNNQQIPADAYFEIEKIAFFKDINAARNVDF